VGLARSDQGEGAGGPAPLWPFELRDTAPAEPVPAVVEAEGPVGDDERDHPLPEAVVGAPDRDRLADVGVGLEHALDLGRGDVLAAADDDVLEAAHDREPPLVVDGAEVPGA